MRSTSISNLANYSLTGVTLANSKPLGQNSSTSTLSTATGHSKNTLQLQNRVQELENWASLNYKVTQKILSSLNHLEKTFGLTQTKVTIPQPPTQNSIAAKENNNQTLPNKSSEHSKNISSTAALQQNTTLLQNCASLSSASSSGISKIEPCISGNKKRNNSNIRGALNLGQTSINDFEHAIQKNNNNNNNTTGKVLNSQFSINSSQSSTSIIANMTNTVDSKSSGVNHGVVKKVVSSEVQSITSPMNNKTNKSKKSSSSRVVHDPLQTTLPLEMISASGSSSIFSFNDTRHSTVTAIPLNKASQNNTKTSHSLSGKKAPNSQRFKTQSISNRGSNVSALVVDAKNANKNVEKQASNNVIRRSKSKGALNSISTTASFLLKNGSLQVETGDQGPELVSSSLQNFQSIPPPLKSVTHAAAAKRTSSNIKGIKQRFIESGQSIQSNLVSKLQNSQLDYSNYTFNNDNNEKDSSSLSILDQKKKQQQKKQKKSPIKAYEANSTRIDSHAPQLNSPVLKQKNNSYGNNYSTAKSKKGGENEKKSSQKKGGKAVKKNILPPSCGGGGKVELSQKRKLVFDQEIEKKLDDHQEQHESISRRNSKRRKSAKPTSLNEQWQRTPSPQRNQPTSYIRQETQQFLASERQVVSSKDLPVLPSSSSSSSSSLAKQTNFNLANQREIINDNNEKTPSFNLKLQNKGQLNTGISRELEKVKFALEKDLQEDDNCDGKQIDQAKIVESQIKEQEQDDFQQLQEQIQSQLVLNTGRIKSQVQKSAVFQKSPIIKSKRNNSKLSSSISNEQKNSKIHRNVKKSYDTVHQSINFLRNSSYLKDGTSPCLTQLQTQSYPCLTQTSSFNMTTSARSVKSQKTTKQSSKSITTPTSRQSVNTGRKFSKTSAQVILPISKAKGPPSNTRKKSLTSATMRKSSEGINKSISQILVDNSARLTSPFRKAQKQSSKTRGVRKSIDTSSNAEFGLINHTSKQKARKWTSKGNIDQARQDIQRQFDQDKKCIQKDQEEQKRASKLVRQLSQEGLASKRSSRQLTRSDKRKQKVNHHESKKCGHLFLQLPYCILDMIGGYLGQQIPTFCYVQKYLVTKFISGKIDQYQIQIDIFDEQLVDIVIILLLKLSQNYKQKLLKHPNQSGFRMSQQTRDEYFSPQFKKQLPLLSGMCYKNSLTKADITVLRLYFAFMGKKACEKPLSLCKQVHKYLTQNKGRIHDAMNPQKNFVMNEDNIKKVSGLLISADAKDLVQSSDSNFKVFTILKTAIVEALNFGELQSSSTLSLGSLEEINKEREQIYQIQEYYRSMKDNLAIILNGF